MDTKKKVEQKRANQELAGIPDSKTFNEPGECGESRLLKCHINGVEIAALNLDPSVLACLDYYATDEGIVERNAQPQMRESSGVEMGKDPFAKSLDQRRDDVKIRGMEQRFARDPLLEAAEKHAVPGMAAKFLSGTRIKDRGGTGDYQIVKDERGNDVKVQGMVLGHMPIELRDARNKFYRQRGNRMLREIDKRFRDEVGPQAVSDLPESER